MKKGNTRVSFDFSADAYKRFEEMVKEIGAPNKAEVIRRALWLRGYYEENIREGNKFCLLYPDGQAQQIEIMF